MGLYDSTYSILDNGSSDGQPTFMVTLKLGDNLTTPGGPAEIVFNGNSGQLQWGVDNNGDVDSDSLYPPPNYCQVILNIPAGSSQAPAQLTVGVAQTIQVPGVSYNYITHVLVEALVTGTLTPQSGCYLVVRWHNLSISFTDSAGNVTTNAPITPDVYSFVGNYSPLQSDTAKQITPKADTFSLPLSMVMATPSTNFANGYPVSVLLQGGLEIVSTDSVLKNAGNGLNATNLQAKVNVWTQ